MSQNDEGRSADQRAPAALGAWRSLLPKEREAWLDAASRRFFDETTRVKVNCDPGREIVLDGAEVDGRLGFYCAMGEAVNGPGGYFGRSLQGFDDALFGGFGLETPCTILWKNSGASLRHLGSEALLEMLENELRPKIDDRSGEGQAWINAAMQGGMGGTRTLFDEIVQSIRSVAHRGGGEVLLRLE